MSLFAPKEHQSEAVSCVMSSLVLSDRTSVIMPCGTGKTMVGQMVAEALGCVSTVLFFPSIALVRQTLVFWRANGMLNGADCMCVCSDDSVADNDDVVVTEEDIGMHITTSAEEVSSFFVSSQRRKVVFCTYHSAPTLGAGMPQGMKFDLGIFDEAHRTASSNDSAFSFALDDANLPITKRVFMTATPRHQVDGESAYSMDDESIYGKRSYVLPFRKAIDDGLICDYKVLISTVTSAEVAEHLAHDKGKTKGGVKAKLIAASIAIKKAMDMTGASKVFAFHGTVAEAELFSSMPETRRETGCDLLHVSGQMGMKTRDRIMADFKKAGRAVLTNARCLTEGIDVPDVDMVTFVDPKRSIVDIVQAVGRGLRTAQGKKVGYILLPVYVDLAASEDGDISKLVSNSQMRHIWSVLANMAEQESMVSLSNSAGMAKFRAARRARIEFDMVGDPAIVSSLRQEIDVFYANSNQHGFEENFEELLEFKKKTGSANPRVSENKKLANWARHLRYVRGIGGLSAEKVAMLDEIGFAWNGRDPLWQAKFEDFKSGKKNYRWEAEQRKRYREKTLDEDRQKQLAAAGFDFDPMGAPKAPIEKKLSAFDEAWRAKESEDVWRFFPPCSILLRAFGFRAEGMSSEIFWALRTALTSRKRLHKELSVQMDSFSSYERKILGTFLCTDFDQGDKPIQLQLLKGLMDLGEAITEDYQDWRFGTVIDYGNEAITNTEAKKHLLKMRKLADPSKHLVIYAEELSEWIPAALFVAYYIAMMKYPYWEPTQDEMNLAKFAKDLRLAVEMPNGNILSVDDF